MYSFPTPAAQNLQIVSQVYGFFGLRDRQKRQSHSFEIARVARALFSFRHFKRRATPTPSHTFVQPNSYTGEYRGRVWAR